MNIPDNYVTKVKSRSTVHYIVGLLVRLKLNIKYSIIRSVARYNGATVGDGSILTWKLACRANSNLIIGEDCAIESANFDLRMGGGKIVIHDHVIINKEVSIIRQSHYIDNDKKFTTQFFPDLHINSYTWIATGAKILPQVNHIGVGCVCGAYSVICKNCEDDGVYAGNPAKLIRKHNTRFTDLVVCSLQGGDFYIYKKARRIKWV